MAAPRPSIIVRLEDRTLDLVVGPGETLYNALLTLIAERERLNATDRGEIRYSYGPQEAALTVSYKSGFSSKRY